MSNYQNREEEIKAQLSIEEIINQIQNTYHAGYDPSSDLNARDQLLACEAVAEATPIKERCYQENERTNDNNTVVTGMINDTRKLNPKFDLTLDKLQLFTKSKTFNYRTPLIKISKLLEEFFKEWPSKLTHWPFIAQTYTPKTINSVLNRLVNLQNSGYLIDNPPGLFTLIIQKRPKRKTNIAINDIRKQHI